MNTKKNLFWFLIIAAIIIGGYYYLTVSKKTEKKEETVKQEEISKRDLVAKDLASKYQAVSAGEEELTYTLQAQERFVTGKPTLFTGAYVDDIFNRDGKIFVRFSSAWFSKNNYMLELECSREIVDKILGQKGANDFLDFDGEYIVVANIEEVTKPAFALDGSALSEDEVEIDIEPSELFIAKGICVDVSYISNDREL